MSSIKLEMTVEILGFDESVSESNRGRALATIRVSDDTDGKCITLLGDDKGQFEPTNVASMLRVFGDIVSRNWVK